MLQRSRKELMKVQNSKNSGNSNSHNISNNRINRNNRPFVGLTVLGSYPEQLPMINSSDRCDKTLSEQCSP